MGVYDTLRGYVTLATDHVTSHVTAVKGNHSNSRLILASGAAALLGIAVVIRIRNRKKYNLPPGPKPWPIVGNLIEMFGDKEALTFFTKLQKKYGDIYTLYIGPTPMIVLGSAEFVREAFIRQGDATSGRPQTFSFDLFSDGGKDIVAAQPHAVWKVQRKIVHQAIKKFGTGAAMEELIYDSVDKVSDLLQKEEGPFDPAKHITLLIYNLIASMTLGKRMEVDDPIFTNIPQLSDEFNELFGQGFVADIFPIFRYFPSRAVNRTKVMLNEIMALFVDALKEHRDTYEPGNVTDFTYTLLDIERDVAQEEGSAEAQLTNDHFIMMMGDLFFAGTDTTRYTLTWIVQYMAMYPEIQKKVQDEIQDAVGEGRRIRLADRQKLAYTNAVIHECMRLRPVVPLAIPHVTTEDISLGGYHIPANSQIVPNMIALHQHPADWEQPDVFKPERFLDKDGQFVSKAGWLPFSTGKRLCVGESLAKTELLMFFACLLQRFTFSAAPGEKLTAAMKEVMLATMPEPFNIVVKSNA